MKKNIYKIIAVLFFLSAPAFYSQVNIEDQIRLAQGYEQAGQLSKAEEIYKQLCNIQQWNGQLTELLNRVYISQKKYSESIELLTNRIKQVPTDLNLYGLLGSTYYMLGQLQNAYDCWEKAIAASPSSYISFRIAANYAIENRDYPKAIEYLKRGEKFTPDPTIFSYDLANLYAVNMKFKEAVNEFCAIIILHPEQTQIIKSRIVSYLNKPDAGVQTVQAINELIDSKPLAELYDLLASVYMGIGDYENAFHTVVSLEEKFKSNGSYIFTFAQEAFRNQQYEWAAKAFEYIFNNSSNSQFIQIAKIGNARSLEAALDKKFFRQNNSWKPYSTPAPLFTNEYKNIINAYEEFLKQYPNDAANVEALYRIAKIFGDRIFDYTNAINFYERIINISQTSSYTIKSNIELGKIYIQKNDLDRASLYFEKAKNFPQVEPNDLSEAAYYIACIQFWKGDFTGSITLLNSCSKNLSVDFTNDALELSSIITATKKDSLNLFKFAKADLFALQNKYKEAGIEFKTLSDDSNLFLINNFAKINFAEILIAENNYSEAFKILGELMNDRKIAIFAEKSTFLLAQCYQYGTGDLNKAVEIYQKLLETFPNSLYFDRVRGELNSIQQQSERK